MSTTRTHSRIDIPPHYYRTPRRARFFDAYDQRPTHQALLQFCKQHKSEEWCPSQPTASRWLKQRAQSLDDVSPERRPRARGVGRPRKNVTAQVEIMATGPTTLRKNDYNWHAQQAGVSGRTLRRRIDERRPRIIRSFRRNTEYISKPNKTKRKAYGQAHKHETVDSLWQWIHWTDETHIDRAMSIATGIFRELGNYEGLVYEEPVPLHLVVHVAASVSYWHKSELIFYNDGQWTHQHLLKVWKKDKPRRNRRTKPEEQYQQELRDWEAKQPPETVKQGNSMTQAYYNSHILPQHLYHIQKQKEQGYPAILMEDGDPSHGHQSVSNLPAEARRKALVALHDHPAQSPDLNPIEACWLLLKEKLKQLYDETLHQMNYWQLKEAIKHCWSLITMQQIRERIDEMPWRCTELIRTGGSRIKGDKW